MTLGAVLIGVVIVRLALTGVVINSREGVYPSTLTQNDHQAPKGHQSCCSCSTLGALDMMIAAHAVAENATLVTHDKAFSLVPGGVLTVEDWINVTR